MGFGTSRGERGGSAALHNIPASSLELSAAYNILPLALASTNSYLPSVSSPSPHIPHPRAPVLERFSEIFKVRKCAASVLSHLRDFISPPPPESFTLRLRRSCFSPTTMLAYLVSVCFLLPLLTPTPSHTRPHNPAPACK